MSKKHKEGKAPATSLEASEEARLDEALDESFPASDSPAVSPREHAAPSKDKDKKAQHGKS